jgi:hypothetical protein
VKDYAEHWAHLAQAEPGLAADLRDLRGLGGVMAWMSSRGLALGHVEIVQQDEFSLDFVIPLHEGGRHLVFGIT